MMKEWISFISSLPLLLIMIIRKATLKDAEGVCKVADALKIDYCDPQKYGFLVYCLKQDEYAHRIKASDFFYVAVEGNKVVGFLMCYDSDTLKMLMKSGKLNHEDALIKKISGRQGKYIFCDQIGIMPDKISKGIGTSLMHRLFEDIASAGINILYLDILHKPAMNTHSQKFFKKHGFIYQETVMNSDKHQWGIYGLTLPNN